MPVKTSSCIFSEERIYPGHGINFIRRDGKKLQFVTCKTKHLYLGNRKALKLRWTKAWRRAHKKESILRSVKKDKGRRTLKSERGIEGLTLQDLLRKKNQSAQDRKQNVDNVPKIKPQSKNAKKQDLNSRLRELRKKRKAKDVQQSDKQEKQEKQQQKGKGKGKQQQKGKGKGKGKGKKK
eukprot:447857_1